MPLTDKHYAMCQDFEKVNDSFLQNACWLMVVTATSGSLAFFSRAIRLS